MRCLLAIPLSVLIGFAAHADDHVRSVQTRLKKDGFYYGAINGAYDAETSAAVTRYQIRNGLQITGQLDTQTANALGVSAPIKDPSSARDDPQTWRSLRKTDKQFLESLSAGGVPDSTPVPVDATPSAADATSRFPSAPNYERLRDYVAAFILAGIAPPVGSELEFFAERVDYFGEKNVTREKIRHDLERYDARWPERRFWLAGELDVQFQPGKSVTVTFPLHYELRSRAAKASGRVQKTLVLKKRGEDLQIIAVDEKK
ncbi:MAG: peptidoglycan-binding protein [Verrucomicrobiota bacterium]|nr:peptidoglycan-binding protein [Verrucomicrobiota bacterium]